MDILRGDSSQPKGPRFLLPPEEVKTFRCALCDTVQPMSERSGMGGPVHLRKLTTCKDHKACTRRKRRGK